MMRVIFWVIGWVVGKLLEKRTDGMMIRNGTVMMTTEVYDRMLNRIVDDETQIHMCHSVFREIVGDVDRKEVKERLIKLTAKNMSMVIESAMKGYEGKEDS